MKPLSKQTQDLVARLETATVLQTLARAPEEVASVVRQVGDSAEVAAVPSVLPFVLHSDGRLAGAAAAAVRSLLQGASPADLAHLDQVSRQFSFYRSLPGWYDINPAHLAQLAGSSASIALLGMASFHPSGYVRQESVNRLAALQGGEELPFLLIRLNDWVEPVRGAARRAVETRLTTPYARHFLSNLPLVLRLAGAGRGGHSPFIQAVQHLLKDPAASEALSQGLSSTDRVVRRWAYRLAADVPERDRVALLRRGLADPDLVVRLWVAERIRAEGDEETRRALLPTMAVSRLASVRRLALYAYAEEQSGEAADVLRKALLDPHISVRETARYYLAKREAGDFRHVYAEALSSATPASLSAAISGVGETGTPSDTPLMTPFLTHPTIRVRKAAIEAVGRLKPSDMFTTLIPLLADEHPGVSRTARDVLGENVSMVDAPRLWDRFPASAPRHARLNVIWLLAKLTKWESIGFILRATQDEDSEVAEAAREHLRDWISRFSRSFTVPTREQLNRLRGAVAQVGQSLDPALREYVTYLLDSVIRP